VFASFKDPRNRSREAWVLSAQTLLNHPLRAAQAVRYVRPSLELLEEIERTGDIFFPLRWLNATLEGHQSVAAAADVVAFLTDRPTYPQRLREKVLQAADPLFRVTGVTFDGRTEGE
jgi:aminopeptidase N